LRLAHTLAALNRLAAIGVVDEEASYQLRRGYQFLRRAELVLRRVDNTSVSRIPDDEREQYFLAKRLGFATTDEFLGNYRLFTQHIRALYVICLRQLRDRCGDGLERRSEETRALRSPRRLNTIPG